MTIDFTCAKCEGSFEIDAEDLIDGTEKLVCPHCDAKAGATMVDDFIAALTEIRSQAAALSKKFAVNFAIETDEAADDDDEDEEEETDEDEELDEVDDDELDEDEDEEPEEDSDEG